MSGSPSASASSSSDRADAVMSSAAFSSLSSQVVSLRGEIASLREEVQTLKTTVNDLAAAVAAGRSEFVLLSCAFCLLS